MPEETSKITIIADLLKRDPAYKEVVDQLEERLYNRYMVYLADKPRFNSKTQAIPKEYLAQILSFKNTLELNKISKKYNLSQDQRDIIPAVLWKIFWRGAEIKNLPQMLNGELGLNNIRVAYQMALDIAPIYMPISDYLGDLGMVMKRWQYELPQEAQPATYNIQPTTTPKVVSVAEKPIQPTTGTAPVTAQSAPAATVLQPTQPTTITPPPIRQPEIAALSPVARNDREAKDESIARVQETMARISGQMAKIQSPSVVPITNEESQRSFAPMPSAQDDKRKSDIEPEYLPDTPPTHSANIIDLKNF